MFQPAQAEPLARFLLLEGACQLGLQHAEVRIVSDAGKVLLGGTRLAAERLARVVPVRLLKRLVRLHGNAAVDELRLAHAAHLVLSRGTGQTAQARRRSLLLHRNAVTLLHAYHVQMVDIILARVELVVRVQVSTLIK